MVELENLPVTSLIALLQEQGRSALLEELKALGVAKLPERQKLAGAVAKQMRDMMLPPRAPFTPLPMHPPPSAAARGWLGWTGEGGGGWLALRDIGQSSSPQCDCPELKDIIVLDGILTQSECQQLVARAEAAGFEESKHQGVRDDAFRRGGRAAISDGGLAAEIFARISRALPATLPSEDATTIGDWHARGVWEALRVLSYGDGDFFLPHFDNPCGVGHSSILPSCRSFYSLLLYLADSPDGCGATRFYCGDVAREDAASAAPAVDEDATLSQQHSSALDDSGMDQPPEERARNRRPANCVVADVVPWAGRAVIFKHRILHESMPVSPGARKLVVRSDVLYGPCAVNGEAAHDTHITRQSEQM